MIRVYDYTCTRCGATQERFMQSEAVAEKVACNECEGTSVRRMPAPRAKLEGITGAFPGAYDAWERKRAEHMKVEQRKARDHGDDGWH